MSTKRRIGILTGGGDVPGLNAAIKSVTYRATELGWEVVGIRRGWQGLTHLQPGTESEATYLVALDRLTTRTIDRTGGTWLHSSRTNPRKMKKASLPAHLDAARAEGLRVGEDRYDLDADRARRTSRPSVSTTSSPSAAMTRSATRRSCTMPAPTSSPSPRPWTTTSRARSTASASPRPSPERATPSTGSVPRSAPTSASASSASSVGTPASRPSTRPS